VCMDRPEVPRQSRATSGVKIHTKSFNRFSFVKYDVCSKEWFHTSRVPREEFRQATNLSRVRRSVLTPPLVCGVVDKSVLNNALEAVNPFVPYPVLNKLGQY
jgi:hypothetical protein